MAQMKEMIEMNRLVGEMLIASDKFLKEYTAKEAKKKKPKSIRQSNNNL